MCPVLECNLGDVPDEIVPFDKGVYLLTVANVPEVVEKATKAGGTGQMLSFGFVVSGDEDGNPCEASENKRVAFCNLCLWTMPGKVAYKRLQKSCGMPIQDSVDLEEFVGKVCKAKIGVRTYHDDDAGEDRTVNDIKSFIIPEEGSLGDGSDPSDED